MQIDGWTIALQALNLLVLLALLRWLFYKPVLKVIADRQAGLKAARAAAEAGQRAADERLAKLSAEREALAAERSHWLADAQAQAEEEKAALLVQGRAEAQALLVAARASMATERQAAQAQMQTAAGHVAVALARRLLAQTPADGQAGFVRELLDRVEAEPAESRAAWFALNEPRSATLASARPLSDEVQRQASRRLLASLGAKADAASADSPAPGLKLDFEVDPALLAGLELRLPHGVLAHHWSAELAAAGRMLDGAGAVSPPGRAVATPEASSTDPAAPAASPSAAARP